MARKSAWLLAVVLAVVTAPALPAQDRPRPGLGQDGRSPVRMLANQKSVQEELKLSDEQIKKVAEIGKAMRLKAEDITETVPKERMKKAMELFKVAEKDVFAMLKREQAKRMRQIALQQQRLARGFENPEVAKVLKLSEEQTRKMREIRESASTEISKLAEGAKSRDEAQKKRAEFAKATEEKLLKVLTDEQRARWTELLGEPFKGELKGGFGLREAGDKKKQ
jgi:Spy/CpxP family protein refolding chaperone